MKRILLTVAMLVAARAAHADHYQKYFPLKEANSWTFQHQTSDAETYVTVTDSFGPVRHVTGIPGAQSGLWVAWSGNTLYAWRPSTESWVPFLRFGAPAGTAYNVTLDYPFWTNTQVLIKVKGFESENPLIGKTFTNCIHFVLGDFENGSPRELVFAPNVGLIFYSNWLDDTYDRYFLESAVLNGKRFGVIPQQTMESGAFTSYPVEGTNKVLVINSQAAWNAFYAQHNPGAEVPKADFTKQTVLVVLAGQRGSSGYWLEVPRVTWNYPWKSATASVVEHKPGGIVLWVITQPFTIVLLDEKVYKVSVGWKTVVNEVP